MSLPTINLEELRKLKEDNFKERLKFIDSYTNWLKTNSNKKWSSEQKELVT